MFRADQFCSEGTYREGDRLGGGKDRERGQTGRGKGREPNSLFVGGGGPSLSVGARCLQKVVLVGGGLLRPRAGTIGVCRMFIENFAKKAEPINDLCKKGAFVSRMGSHPRKIYGRAQKES
jgi:hypothetical protein